MSAGGKARVERTRRAILDAGEAVFLEHGFLGASMDQVSEMAGVSKQTVYAHLQSKEALFLEVVGGMTGGAGDRLAEQVADPQADRPLADFLLDFAQQQLEIVLTPRLMRLRRLVIGEVGRFPELGRMLHERGPARSIARLTYGSRIKASTPSVIRARIRVASAASDGRTPSRVQIRDSGDRTIPSTNAAVTGAKKSCAWCSTRKPTTTPIMIIANCARRGMSMSS